MTINSMVAGKSAAADSGDAMSDRVKEMTASAAAVGARLMRSASRATYTTTYMLSYGVVFAALFVARSLPLENPVGHGIVDGGRAARDAVAGS